MPSVVPVGALHRLSFSVSFWPPFTTQQHTIIWRTSVVQPQHPPRPAAHTHTLIHPHRNGGVQRRQTGPPRPVPSDTIDAAMGHCGGPSGFPREHAVAGIFEISLAPGASNGVKSQPGGWRRPNGHRRLRRAIVQPPSPSRITPSQPSRDETHHPSPGRDEATTYVIVCKLKLLKEFSLFFRGAGGLQGRCGNCLVACDGTLLYWNPLG